jgi:hypothetical protein
MGEGVIPVGPLIPAGIEKLSSVTYKDPTSVITRVEAGASVTTVPINIVEVAPVGPVAPLILDPAKNLFCALSYTKL